MNDEERSVVSAAVPDDAGSIANLADGFVHAYYGNDPEWTRWLADLRAACRRLDDAEVNR